jgi:hypothetical protein
MGAFVRRASLAAALSALSVLEGCVVHEEPSAEPEVVVAREPPSDQVEQPGPAPGSEYLWIHGHWSWNGSDWIWRGGHWEVRRTGFEWIPGRWARRSDGWVWVEGRWKRS